MRSIEATAATAEDTLKSIEGQLLHYASVGATPEQVREVAHRVHCVLDGVKVMADALLQLALVQEREVAAIPKKDEDTVAEITDLGRRMRATLGEAWAVDAAVNLALKRAKSTNPDQGRREACNRGVKAAAARQEAAETAACLRGKSS